MEDPNVNRKNAAGANRSQPSAPDDSDAPIPLDIEDPIPLADAGTATKGGVSHTPLNLGGGSAAAAPRVQAPKPATARPVQKTVSTDRITGVKTFFTKLHPGALAFLDEQIGNWLKENPGVVVKHTNITTGEVQAKKTEPNIIVTVWY